MSGEDSPVDGAGTDSGGSNPLRQELREDCRDALIELQEERPEAEVIAVKGDWAWVSIGTVYPSRVNNVFDQEKAHAVIRIPTNFPNGTRPYGIVTYPYVTKRGGQDANKEHHNHTKGEPAREALDVDEVGFWSYKWKNISWDGPEDLRKAPEIVKSRFEKED